MDAIEIIRSKKRKKTVQAKKKNATYYIYLPAGLSKAEEEKWVSKLVNQLKKREQQSLLCDNDQLRERANILNNRFFKGSLDYSIQFVENQQKRFGSCNPKLKSIRISTRIATMPKWVQDYVILHELSHLIYPNHSLDFWQKVKEYPLCERARGYLIAIGLDDIEQTE